MGSYKCLLKIKNKVEKRSALFDISAKHSAQHNLFSVPFVFGGRNFVALAILTYTQGPLKLISLFL
jgi:hypothetical protein